MFGVPSRREAFASILAIRPVVGRVPENPAARAAGSQETRFPPKAARGLRRMERKPGDRARRRVPLPGGA
jgi:hypothetical protein